MKKLLLLAVSLLGMASAQAQTITAEDVEALKGKDAGVISVALATNGASGIRDAQFSFVVPTGLTLGTIEKGEAATDNGDEAYTYAISDGVPVTNGTKYTVVVYSTDAENFVDGAILNIPVSVPADYSGTYWAETAYDLDGIAYTVEDATETAVAADTYKFEVGLLGDANKSGSVTADDATAILSAYLGTLDSTAPFSALAANANEDAAGDVTADDATAALQIYLAQ